MNSKAFTKRMTTVFRIETSMERGLLKKKRRRRERKRRRITRTKTRKRKQQKYISSLKPLCSPAALQTRAFGLQTDVERPASTTSFVRYDFRSEAEERPPIAEATLCYRFSIARYRSIVPFVSYAYSDKADNAILVCECRGCWLGLMGGSGEK